MTWTESLNSVKITHSNGPPILEFDLSSERLPFQHPVQAVFATRLQKTILETISCSKIAVHVLDSRNAKIKWHFKTKIDDVSIGIPVF